MTLVEVVVAGAITSILALAVCTSMIYSGRSLAGLSNYVELDNASRNSLEHFMADLRGCSTILSLTTNAQSATLVCTNNASAPADRYRVTYRWDKDTTTLTRFFAGCNEAGSPLSYSQAVLTNCDDFRFELKSRALNGQWQLAPASQIAQCKFVTVHWRCTKEVKAARQVNTESVQTAGIMLRNQHLQ